MENKTNNYYAALSRLVRFFERTTSGFAFAVMENQNKFSFVNNNLAEMLRERNLFLKILNFDVNSKKTIIEQIRFHKKENNAIVINNLGELIQLSSETKNRNFLSELNFAREELLKIGTPILFWVSTKALSIISNHAADLYSQRSINTQYFDDTPDDKLQETFLFSRFNENFRNTPDYKEIETKLKLQKRQLDDAEEGKFPATEVAQNYAIPLAKTYSSLDLHTQALEIIDRYAKLWENTTPQTKSDIADIYFAAQNYEKALEYYLNAYNATNELTDLKALLSLKIAGIYYVTGNFTDCEKYLNEALIISKQLESKEVIAVVYERMGALQQLFGDFDKALQFFKLENDLFKELYEANPKSENIKNGLAISYSKLGDIYQSLGDFDKALVFFNLLTDLFKELYEANPKSENIKNGLAISYEKLGDIYQSLGDFDKALVFFNLRTQLGKELYEANPKSENIKNGLAISYEKLGVVYFDLNNEKEAKRNFENCKVLWEQLFKKNRQSIIIQSNYAEILAITAILEIQNNFNKEQTKTQLQPALNIWQSLSKQTQSPYFENKIKFIEGYLQGSSDYKTTIINLSK